MGEAKAVGHWQGLRINALAADDIDVFFGRTSIERRLQGREHFGVLKGKTFLAREHDVAAIWQGTFRERLKSAASHNDGVSRGEGLEAAQVGREMIKQFVLIANGAVGSQGTNDGQHGLMGFENGMWFAGSLTKRRAEGRTFSARNATVGVTNWIYGTFPRLSARQTETFAGMCGYGS